MKKHLIATLIACLPLSTLATASDKTVTLINHYNKPLNFLAGTNPETVPDLPKGEFTLNVNDQITTKVLAEAKQAYIRAQDDEKHDGFFGVRVVNDELKIGGYHSRGIAFSWNTNQIVFCTPEEYRTKNTCL